MRRLTFALLLVLLAALPALAQGTSIPPSIEWLDEGVSQGRVTKINCVGTTVDCARSGTTGTVTISGSSGGYATVQEDGSALTQRTTINFIGTSVTCADDAGNTRTNCTIAAGAVTPGGASGDLQTNDGAGGFGAYAGDSCTNQFPTAIDSGGNLTCTSPTLAGAQFANQGTTTTVLHGNAAGNPSWGAVSLTADVTGDLPYSSLAQGSALSVLGVTGNATADNASIAAGSDKQVLRREGTAVAFGAVDLASSAAVTGVLDEPNGGTGQSTVTQGDILYGSAANTWSKLPAGTSGHFLKTNGAGANPEWAAASGGSAKFYFVGHDPTSRSVTTYMAPIGYCTAANSCHTTEGTATRLMVPASGTIKNLYARFVTTQGASDVCTVTVAVGADMSAAPSATTLVCAIGDGQVSCSNTSDTPSVSVTNSIQIQMVETAGTCITGGMWWAFELVPS